MSMLPKRTLVASVLALVLSAGPVQAADRSGEAAPPADVPVEVAGDSGQGQGNRITRRNWGRIQVLEAFLFIAGS